MTGSASDNRSGTDPEREGFERGPFERAPFLATPRAINACAREIGRLSDTLVRGALALRTNSAKDEAKVRQSPGRCIVQLGPVAITVAWLLPTFGSIADGELLVILWRGAVAPRGEQRPERAPVRRPASTATPLWEQTLIPVASSEETWAWKWRDEHADDCTSSDLAAGCLDRLRLAYDACANPDEPDPHPPVRKRVARGG
jgi:hypothetical protein